MYEDKDRGTHESELAKVKAERDLFEKDAEGFEAYLKKAELDLKTTREDLAERDAKLTELSKQLEGEKQHNFLADNKRVSELAEALEDVKKERDKLNQKVIDQTVHIRSLTRERDELRAEFYKASTRLEDAGNRADALQAKLDEWSEYNVQLYRELSEAQAERDELQAKLDAANQRPTLDREEVEEILALNSNMNAYHTECVVDAILSLDPAVPAWIGDIPDKPEVKRTDAGDWFVSGAYYDDEDRSAAWWRKDGYRRIALANAMEVEEAATRDDEQRIEKQSERLYLSTQGEIAVAWESLTEPMRNGFRAAIDAGWTPPESEDKK